VCGRRCVTLRCLSVCVSVSHGCTPVFIPGIFFLGGGKSPPKKLTNPPQTAAKMCALNIFFRPGQRITTISQNFLLMDNKHRKLFVTKQSKGCKFMPKMHQNTFGSRAPPEPAGELMCSPRSPSRNGGLLVSGGREGVGSTSKGTGGQTGRNGRAREFPPESQGEQNKQ